MIDSINVAITGLHGYSQGLKVIGNNTANLNTPGFKGSTLQFADMFYSNSPSGGTGMMQVGYGLNTAGTMLNFTQGELSQTGNQLDLAVDGQGLFALQDSDGNIHYTRAGQFKFNTDGVLVSRIDGSKVMALNADGSLSPITLDNYKTQAGKATSTISFSGNLSSGGTTQTVNNVQTYDSLGGQHQLTLQFTNNSSTTPGQWTVQVMDGTTTVGSGTILFSGGSIDPANSTVSVTYAPAGVPSIPVTLDFSKNVTSFNSGTLSSLAVASQDGYGPGSLTRETFDTSGTLVFTYSNGQTVRGPRLALGRFDSLDAVSATGDNEFDAMNGLAWHTGVAGENGFGSVRAGMIELSNVDLSTEFSNLVIMQRGYQASSQVVSTANDMLQQLFEMKSK